MTQVLSSFAGRFGSCRSSAAPSGASNASRLMSRLRALRANPALIAATPARPWIERQAIAWHNFRVIRRWQRELSALDDRLMRDVGISRADARLAIRQAIFRAKGQN